VGQREEAVFLPRQRGQRPALGQGNGQRLVADDVDARLEKSRGDGGVQVIGRDDGDDRAGSPDSAPATSS